MWKEIWEHQESELKWLAIALLQTVLGSRDDSTTRKYTGAYNGWKAWEEKHGLNGLLVDVSLFAFYLQHVGETTQSCASVGTAVDAVVWVQMFTGEETIAQNSIIKTIRTIWERKTAKPTK